MYQSDYIMREMETLSRFIKAIFGKDSSLEIIDEQGNISERGLLYHDLKSLVSQNKINEAEDLLFEKFEQSPNAENLEIAIQFYKILQSLSDENLENAGFPRHEIVQGLEAIKRRFLENQPSLLTGDALDK